MKRMAALAVWIPLLWAQADRSGVLAVTAVRHWSLGDVTRVAVEVSAEFTFHTDRLHNPERVYFDISNAVPHIGQHPMYSELLEDDSRVVRLRVAETIRGVTRVVLDLAGPSDVTTSQLANPDRLIIEVRSGPGPVMPPHMPRTTEPEGPERTPGPPKADPIAPAMRQVKAIVAAADLASAEMVMAEPSQTQLAPAPPARPEDASKSLPAPDASNPDMAPHDPAAGLTAPAATSAIPAGMPDGVPSGLPSGVPSGPDKAARHDSSAALPAPAATAGAIPAGVPSGVPSGPGKAARRDSATALSATVPPTPAGVLDGPGKAARHTASGDNSLIRELGLKISRVVIDPGHGGHDEGTQGAHGLQEKELVLDVAKRVGKLIEEKMGAEVVYTRSDDTFIPLERRTAIANEKKADLFLSIHANSSPVARITGMETYYLNFADTKDAMDVAARENAAAHQSIFELRDIVQKITLHDKAEESKELASRIQSSLYALAARELPGTRNRGVKKAPFVVLIGAQIPSVLAEIGFLSNPREEILLKRSDYRQKLAEALYRGVQRYADGLSHFQVAQQTQNRP
ncbi:MAG: N-acetylmuramoyl-L-alanine amidase [Bryobacteraceae bacterium]